MKRILKKLGSLIWAKEKEVFVVRPRHIFADESARDYDRIQYAHRVSVNYDERVARGERFYGQKPARYWG